ncbi:Transporter of the ATP-binding cassette (ABC) [Pseudogymnoascus australis]
MEGDLGISHELGNCSWPIWQVDDFSNCFQRDYLKVLLPLVAFSLSFLLIISQAIRRKIAARRTRVGGYEPLSNGNNAFGVSEQHQNGDLDSDADRDSEEEALTIGAGRLALAKKNTTGSVNVLDRPRAQYSMVIIEELALLGLIAVSATAFATQAYGPYGGQAAVAQGLTWVYIFILATFRLVLSDTKYRIPRLWDHTAVLYTTMWLLQIIIFRSVLIHPRTTLTQVLVVSEFSLTTLLFGIALTTRKGNKAVVMEWDGDIEPSREPLASLFSLATFSWVDSIVYTGYIKTLEITDVWNLAPKDKTAAVLDRYRQLPKTMKLMWHLLRFFRGKLLAQCTYAFFSAWFTFAPTLLLKSILEYIEDPGETPRNVIWLYVILLAFTDIIRSLLDQQALWIGRKVCIQLRAIIIGELYAKALRRKAAASSDTVLGEKQGKEDAAKPSRLSRLFGFAKKKEPDNKSATQAPEALVGGAAKSDSDAQVNVGTIINLMSVDSFKVAEISSYLHFLLSAGPTQLVVSVILLYQVLGWSSIPGLVVMLFLLPINIGFAFAFGRAQKKIMAATDKRIHTTNEILQNIRVIKFFAWEHRFSNLISDKRKDELKQLRGRFIIWSFAVAVWNTVPVTITFFSFLVYTMVEKKPLYPSVAFTAISLFNILRVPLDQLGDMIAHVNESSVSITRVEEFLNEEETEKYDQLAHDNVDENGNEIIGFDNGCFSWASKDEVVAEGGTPAFRLMDLDVRFAVGKLNIIAGPTGSGKTSLIMALLGEMSRITGEVHLPGGYSREDVRPDPDTGLTESVAYCAQQAWLVNANIKQNILFAQDLDEKRYRDVIIACALERDLDILDNGDQTLVGEKGITLSGGQKQRISLARALYSNSRHLLLDDCLSAVDSHTAKWIFDNCITGPLMRNRTCILVSHNLALCVPSAEHVVVLDNGRISVQGNPIRVISSGKLGEDLPLQLSSAGLVSQIPSRVPSSVGEQSDKTLIDSPAEANEDGTTDAAKPKGPKKVNKPMDAMEESKAVGSVKFETTVIYLKAMGPWWFWVLAVIVFGVQQLAAVSSNVWIREWANQYDLPEEASKQFVSTTGFMANPAASNAMSNTQGLARFIPYFSDEWSLKALIAPDVDVKYYLIVYAGIGLGGMFVALFRDLWLFYGSLTASWSIHQNLIHSVTRAQFKFFDVTPLGQIMNRFSKDLESIDQQIAPVAIGVASCALAIVVTITLISAITPGFLIAAAFISVIYFLIGRFYLRSSRDLKRLESVQRSPLFQQFGETLTGITTIRAYGDEKRFIRDNTARVDTYNRPFIFLWAANRWLSFRIDVVGDLVALFAGMFVIFSIGSIDAGSAGLSLGYAITFTENVLWLVRLYAIYEQNMNSVERIKEYLDVEQEAEAENEKTQPAANWPSQGSVEFINYTTRYRADLDPVLRNVTVKINPLEKVGIVGRTGAGKSSLALALFRGLEAEEGKILIDSVDIGLIGLRDLRESITIVPQDPTLFTGTIRSNLDPFNLFTDEDIFTALRRVQLIGNETAAQTPSTSRPATPGASRTTTSTSLPTAATVAATALPSGASTPATNKNVFLNLSSPVAESGNNLSQGQRQLLCLARALLKNPRVLMMDEATASIDYATDAKIQETIRELTSTIITIAHRLQTIVDYDKVLVLDKGRVVEFDHPYTLLKKSGEEAVFRGMCETSGELEALVKTAKAAWEKGRLVDVDSDVE